MVFVASVWQSLLGMLPEFFGGMAGLLVGWMWGRWQARKAWKSKSFKRSVVLGFNAIENFPEAGPNEPVAALRLRTFFERPLEEVLPLPSMQSLVSSVMQKTTKESPVLPFAKDDAWFVLNSVLNQIATQFAAGTLRKELGYDVIEREFLFCMTFERDDRMHQFKIRIMMMDKEAFLHFPDEGEVAVERQPHRLRVETLRAIKRDYYANPHLFATIKLAY
ncbi:MAG: hypothetical protein EP343_24690 [Deltaproteobacteria bacterium]|nr:MAG: hypothetical protein EP343_24690 [Deltaproteobacteria bacterium]